MREHTDDDGARPGSGIARPDPIPGVSDRLREWAEWFGLARLVTSAVAVVVVCAGAWFLVRTPTPPAESALPIAASDGSPPAATLPTPVATSPTVTAAPVDEHALTIVVHVAGAVVAPGVLELGSGDRVADAIALAGGATPDADPGAINLAAPLVDGSRIYMPEVGEDIAFDLGPAPGSVASDSVPAGPVDVNTADAAALDTLPGVGPATAAAIVAERDRNGPFVSFLDLERVPGIGPSKLAALEGLVVT